MQRRFPQHRPTCGLGGAHCQQRFQTGLALLGGQRFDHGHDIRLCRMRLESDSSVRGEEDVYALEGTRAGLPEACCAHVRRC